MRKMRKIHHSTVVAPHPESRRVHSFIYCSRLSRVMCVITDQKTTNTVWRRLRFVMGAKLSQSHTSPSCVYSQQLQYNIDETPWPPPQLNNAKNDAPCVNELSKLTDSWSVKSSTKASRYVIGGSAGNNKLCVFRAIQFGFSSPVAQTSCLQIVVLSSCRGRSPSCLNFKVVASVNHFQPTFRRLLKNKKKINPLTGSQWIKFARACIVFSWGR